MITDFQHRKLAYFFNLFDHNKNGHLTIEDFSEVAEKICDKLSFRPGTKQYEQAMLKSVALFHKLLRDIPNHESQTIGMEPWIEYFSRELIEKGDEELIFEYIEVIIGFLFDLFDDNHDGYISQLEYKEMFMIYGIDTTYSESIYYKLDLNKDGLLSRNELCHAIETFLTSDEENMSGNWIFGKFE
ncbi:MAG: EF-hand domain-containing protein [Cyclobacteriaceae bacterium]|nr:EF-hand domain-containing protein [Cyclobacteriaceae bacterium]